MCSGPSPRESAAAQAADLAECHGPCGGIFWEEELDRHRMCGVCSENEREPEERDE